MNRKAVVDAVKAIPPGTDHAWDGLGEDERPATAAELGAALEHFRRRRGRPRLERPKVSITFRVDADVADALRARGKGWQTRMNDVLKEWLQEHPST
jgi:uncharacterized protein (DUF4415 family)